TVRMDFQRFATVDPIFKGERITYGLTIPSNAPHMVEALQFIQFLYSPEGQAIMQQNYHPLLIPVVVNGVEKMPDELQSLLDLP
ncbi:MAG TPA: extracellular solute-binding protein, partial [Chloroflexi bacterium]|nr:extracellular solute-binding protein [Chloroflexota bacterium]